MEIRKSDRTTSSSLTPAATDSMNIKAGKVGALFKAPNKEQLKEHSFTAITEGNSKVLQAAKRLFKH